MHYLQFSLIIKEFYNSYISLNDTDLNKYNTLQGKIDDLLFVDDGTCPRCGLNLSVDKINNVNNHKLTSFKTITSNVSFPKCLIISFDLETGGNIIADYDNLILYQNKIRQLLNYSIKLNDFIYELIGLINMPSSDHFTCSIFNKRIKDSFISGNNYYYNDGYHHNSKIFKEKFNLNSLDFF